jgi:hypothetical protein
VIAGVFLPLLLWRLGARLFGPRVGLASAAIGAVYGYFVYYAGALMTEAFYIVAVLWTLDLATAIVQRPDLRLLGHAAAGARPRPSLAVLRAAAPWLRLGFALGLAALLRQLVLLFAPILCAWLVWAAGKPPAGTVRSEVSPTGEGIGLGRRRSALAGLALAMGVVILMVAPWTVRNYRSFGRLVPLNTNAGFAFFWANHPIQGTNFVSILPSAEYQRLIPEPLRGLDEAALDQALLREGLRLVVSDPDRYVRLSASRFKDYFTFWPSSASGTASNLVRVLSFGVCLPLMLYGLWLSATRRARVVLGGQEAGVYLLYAFIVSYSLIHLLSWALIRYRLPVDAVLMAFAAIGAIEMAGHVEAVARRLPRPDTAWLRPPKADAALARASRGAADHTTRGRNARRVAGVRPWS